MDGQYGFASIVIIVGAMSIVFGAFELIGYERNDKLKPTLVRLFGGLGVVCLGLLLKHFGV